MEVPPRSNRKTASKAPSLAIWGPQLRLRLVIQALGVSVILMVVNLSVFDTLVNDLWDGFQTLLGRTSADPRPAVPHTPLPHIVQSCIDYNPDVISTTTPKRSETQTPTNGFLTIPSEQRLAQAFGQIVQSQNQTYATLQESYQSLEKSHQTLEKNLAAFHKARRIELETFESKLNKLNQLKREYKAESQRKEEENRKLGDELLNLRSTLSRSEGGSERESVESEAVVQSSREKNKKSDESLQILHDEISTLHGAMALHRKEHQEQKQESTAALRNLEIEKEELLEKSQKLEIDCSMLREVLKNNKSRQRRDADQYTTAMRDAQAEIKRLENQNQESSSALLTLQESFEQNKNEGHSEAQKTLAAFQKVEGENDKTKLELRRVQALLEELSEKESRSVSAEIEMANKIQFLQNELQLSRGDAERSVANAVSNLSSKVRELEQELGRARVENEEKSKKISILNVAQRSRQRWKARHDKKVIAMTSLKEKHTNDIDALAAAALKATEEAEDAKGKSEEATQEASKAKVECETAIFQAVMQAKAETETAVQKAVLETRLEAEADAKSEREKMALEHQQSLEDEVAANILKTKILLQEKDERWEHDLDHKIREAKEKAIKEKKEDLRERLDSYSYQIEWAERNYSDLVESRTEYEQIWTQKLLKANDEKEAAILAAKREQSGFQKARAEYELNTSVAKESLRALKTGLQSVRNKAKKEKEALTVQHARVLQDSQSQSDSAYQKLLDSFTKEKEEYVSSLAAKSLELEKVQSELLVFKNKHQNFQENPPALLSNTKGTQETQKIFEQIKSAALEMCGEISLLLHKEAGEVRLSHHICDTRVRLPSANFEMLKDIIGDDKLIKVDFTGNKVTLGLEDIRNEEVARTARRELLDVTRSMISKLAQMSKSSVALLAEKDAKIAEWNDKLNKQVASARQVVNAVQETARSILTETEIPGINGSKVKDVVSMLNSIKKEFEARNETIASLVRWDDQMLRENSNSAQERDTVPELQTEIESNANLTATLSTREAELETVSNSFRELQEKYGYVKEALEVSSSRITELSTIVSKQEKDICFWNSQLTQVTNHKDSINSRLAVQKAKTAKLSSELAIEVNKRANLDRALETQKTENTRLSAEYWSQKALLNETTKNLNERSITKDELAGQNKQLVETVSHLHAQLWKRTFLNEEESHAEAGPPLNASGNMETSVVDNSNHEEGLDPSHERITESNGEKNPVDIEHYGTIARPQEQSTQPRGNSGDSSSSINQELSSLPPHHEEGTDVESGRNEAPSFAEAGQDRNAAAKTMPKLYNAYITSVVMEEVEEDSPSRDQTRSNEADITNPGKAISVAVPEFEATQTQPHRYPVCECHKDQLRDIPDDNVVIAIGECARRCIYCGSNHKTAMAVRSHINQTRCRRGRKVHASTSREPWHSWQPRNSSGQQPSMSTSNLEVDGRAPEVEADRSVREGPNQKDSHREQVRTHGSHESTENNAESSKAICPASHQSPVAEQDEDVPDETVDQDLTAKAASALELAEFLSVPDRSTEPEYIVIGSSPEPDLASESEGSTLSLTPSPPPSKTNEPEQTSPMSRTRGKPAPNLNVKYLSDREKHKNKPDEGRSSASKKSREADERVREASISPSMTMQRSKRRKVEEQRPSSPPATRKRRRSSNESPANRVKQRKRNVKPRSRLIEEIEHF
ncbi:hypothetical protein HYFRA_00007696 [Hymenoscyphus fraxineus]|uniref:Uncharacterized protein n=1 Tax=Hymenoscyphus fraxineus TaxID=746836 RepID=A0A9N9KM02_9HELO|nr:hypothetical protein HYFRA_00007696 [Hymenoscyphus fraxineus]